MWKKKNRKKNLFKAEVFLFNRENDYVNWIQDLFDTSMVKESFSECQVENDKHGKQQTGLVIDTLWLSILLRIILNSF